MKKGDPRDELKNGRGRGWAGPYKTREFFNKIKFC